MGLISLMRSVWNRMFRKEITEKFDTEVQLSSLMEIWISKYYSITSGSPYWEDKEDDIKSINFAGYIDDVTAGLVTLDIGVQCPQTPRGKNLQKQADYVLQVINDKVSEGLGNCGLMFKPNGESVDYMEPGTFAPTETDSNGNILGCVFQTTINRNGWRYTRLEYHRFEDTGEEKVYRITNYAYKEKDYGDTANHNFMAPGKQCPLTEVKEWAGLAPDISISNIKRPLYAYFKNPAPNRVDRSSALGVPIWHNALEELEDLDIAWSRKRGETKDSKHMTFLPQSATKYADMHNIKLPRFLRGVEMGIGVSEDNKIHEHVATLLTEQRIKDINSILAMISTKCGFSQGMFQLDEKTGMMTATQVEADDQETIRTIKNIRDALQNAMLDLLYAVNVFADLYSDIPLENWEDTELANGKIKKGLKSQIDFNFGDITYSYKEDKATWMTYVNQQYMPAWLYFTKFEGMEKEEAQGYINEAQQQQQDSGLFGDE